MHPSYRAARLKEEAAQLLPGYGRGEGRRSRALRVGRFLAPRRRPRVVIAILESLRGARYRFEFHALTEPGARHPCGWASVDDQRDSDKCARTNLDWRRSKVGLKGVGGASRYMKRGCGSPAAGRDSLAWRVRVTASSDPLFLRADLPRGGKIRAVVGGIYAGSVVRAPTGLHPPRTTCCCRSFGTGD